MATSADELRQQLDYRRQEINRDLDALGEKVSPGRVAQRRIDKMTRGAHNLKERVMGTIDDTTTSVEDRAGQLTSDLGDTARRMPEMTRERIEGNPLAVGFVAFGAGMLAASLVPATKTESQLAQRAEPAFRQAADEAVETGRQMVEEMKEPAREATEQIKATASEAATAEKDAVRSAVSTDEPQSSF